MAKSNYSEDDDYYTQEFEREGVVSVWLELLNSKEKKTVDALQDCCGVGYYNLDNQEAIQLGEVVSLEKLFSGISYADSFTAKAIRKAQSMGIEAAAWLLVQFDFEYDPTKVSRRPTKELVFIGVFPYNKNTNPNKNAARDASHP